MDLLESVETLNKRLIDYYGKFHNGEANWRIVWSEDQYEKRKSSYSDEGFLLLNPEIREFPKYKQWIHNKYILERIMGLEGLNRFELVGKTSYEPVWTFEDKLGNPLPPKWEAIVLIIDTVHRQAKKAVGIKYRDPEDDPRESFEQKEMRITKLEQDLFGNETEVGDALSHKQGVVVPNNYKETIQ